MILYCTHAHGHMYTCVRTHTHTHTFPSSVSPQGDSKVMSRAQTDETKGWMQIVILVYHYVGGKEVVGRGERGGGAVEVG